MITFKAFSNQRHLAGDPLFTVKADNLDQAREAFKATGLPDQGVVWKTDGEVDAATLIKAGEKRESAAQAEADAERDRVAKETTKARKEEAAAAEKAKAQAESDRAAKEKEDAKAEAAKAKAQAAHRTASRGR